MSPRRPSDICLFCATNLATKTNSHILSKFISTKFLGPKGSPRKGFEVDSETILDKKPKAIQDSAKEDYILCGDCEAYLGIIESLASDTFSNLPDKVKDGHIKQRTIAPDLDLIECTSSNPSVIRLFVYSLFWRVSISNHKLFDDYKLSPEFEEEIRQTILKHKTLTKVDFLASLTANPDLKLFPYSIMTAKSFKDETANILHAPFSIDPYCLIVDRFSFMLFKSVTDINVGFIVEFSNVKATDCKIMVLSEDLWHNIMVKRPAEMLAEAAKRNKDVAKD